MSAEEDQKVLADVQSRFEVSIATLPEQIDVSAYSKVLIITHHSEHLTISHCFTNGSIMMCIVLFIIISSHIITLLEGAFGKVKGCGCTIFIIFAVIIDNTATITFLELY